MDNIEIFRICTLAYLIIYGGNLWSFYLSTVITLQLFGCLGFVIFFNAEKRYILQRNTNDYALFIAKTMGAMVAETSNQKVKIHDRFFDGHSAALDCMATTLLPYNQVRIATAYFGWSGFQALQSTLNGKKIKLLVGRHEGGEGKGKGRKKRPKSTDRLMGLL